MIGFTEHAHYAYGFAPPAPWRRLRRIARRTGRVLRRIVVISLGLAALTGLFVLAYITKRALGLDIVPGVNMLPDRLLESLIWGTG